MAASCDALGVSAAIAKALTTQAGLPDAAIRVTDVLIETQLAASSPNVLTVSIADPTLQTATSGLLTARKIPKFDRRKGLAVATGNAFPIIDLPLDGCVYRLTDIAGTTDLTQPNLTLELQTRAACLMRERLGPLKAIREASLTRAEFIAAAVARVKQYGGIPFVCPLLEVIQPIGHARTSHSGKRVTYETSSEGPEGLESLTLGEMERMLKLAPGLKNHQGNVSLSGAHAKPDKQEIKTSSSGEGSEGNNELDPSLNEGQNRNAKVIMEVARAVEAGERAALGALVAALTESNLENKENGVFQVIPATAASAKVDPNNVEQCAKAFFQTGFGNTPGGAIGYEKANPKASPEEIAYAVEKCAAQYKYRFAEHIAEAKAIYKSAGGSGGESSTAEKPYEYAIGSEETYWLGINKIAGEVQWYLWFGDSDILYYWNSLELILREPVAYIDPINGVIHTAMHISGRTGARIPGKRVKEYEDRCGLFNYDLNVGSAGSSSKGGLTTECTLQIFCQPNFIRAGDVVVLTDPNRKSPWYQNGYSGRWIVVNATRSIFNVYTEVTLAIPGSAELLAPVTEPEAQTEPSKESEGAKSVVEAARHALRNQHNNPDYYEYTEEYDRSKLESLFSGTLPIRVDCSGFATLCYKAPGLPDPNGLGYKPLGNTTTLEAHGHATSNPQPGDLVFWSGPAHVAVYVGGGKVISMGAPGDPEETTVAIINTIKQFVGYRTYGNTAPAKSTTKAASDNVLRAVNLRKPFVPVTPFEGDLLDGMDWDTGRSSSQRATEENEASEKTAHEPGKR